MIKCAIEWERGRDDDQHMESQFREEYRLAMVVWSEKVLSESYAGR